MSNNFQIGPTSVGDNYPCYFIADIGANHDGDIGRAKDLIYSAAESGANAAKFQHFCADTIVSNSGFKSIALTSHQSKWKKSVFDIYDEASINLEWTCILKETCDDAGIEFFTSPYSFDLVDHIDEFVKAYKIGSGDINWLEIIDYISLKQKPIILATGASSMSDVERAVLPLIKRGNDVALLQCNTNYTSEPDNYSYINLNVLKAYKLLFPNIVLGLSDHTPTLTTSLGAVALGAKIIEKHFTDSNMRDGPDHHFAITPSCWREMVDRVRELEFSLGSTLKKVEANESETYVLQRRAIYASKDIQEGETISTEHLVALRPCPQEAISIQHYTGVIGAVASNLIQKGECLKWNMLT